MEEKKIHVPSLVLAIIGLVAALLLPIITYICSIISLVLSIMKRETHKTKACIVIDIVGLVLALANSILGVLMMSSMMG
ncbi:MAG: hypothetical protein LIO69_09920 [Oscillospiraceae bacterium]|nr:hypothetical protein [Oscillospiraceae bacterium]